MSFSGLAANQAISYTNLQDAVTNGYFTLVSSITTSGRESTKSYVAAHVSGFATNYPPYANKASNQLIVKGDIYNPGNFILDPNYGMRFTSMSGSVGGLPTFSFPVTAGNTTLTYNGTIAAQTISVGLAGTLVTSPAKIILYVDNVQVDCQSIVTGTQTKNLVLSIPVNSASTIKISINTGTCSATPTTPSFSGKSFSTVSVNRSSGQYMVAGNTNLYSSSGWIGGYLYYSSNYGSTWTQTTTFGYWIKIASSDNGQYVLAVEAYGKAYLSTNYGVSFTAISSLGTLSYTSAALSSTGQYQMITVYTPSGSSVVYGSSNYGVTWGAILTASGYESYYSCTIDSSSNIYLVGGGGGGQSFLYKSTNHGTSWSTVFTNSSGSSVNDVNIYGGGTVALASQYGATSAGANLILSTNSGTSWSNITAGSAVQSWVRVIIAESTTIGYAIPQLGNSSTSYIQQVSGFYTSPNVSDLTSAGNRNWHSLACSNDGVYILAGTGTGLYLSTNSGTSFTAL
jgi:hypothetical protein